MELGEEERYAAAALFTLALHSTAVRMFDCKLAQRLFMARPDMPVRKPVLPPSLGFGAEPSAISFHCPGSRLQRRWTLDPGGCTSKKSFQEDGGA